MGDGTGASGVLAAPSKISRVEAPAEDARAPAWFKRNVSEPYNSNFVEVHGTPIHYLHWPCKPLTSTASKAGLIFIHGNGAHAHWWAFLAPFFTREYTCLAVS